MGEDLILKWEKPVWLYSCRKHVFQTHVCNICSEITTKSYYFENCLLFVRMYVFVSTED